jgi:signal transduction histidine kinase
VVELTAESNEQTYLRLKTLYGISKVLSTFVSVEKSFPEILNLAADAFPLLNAVLIDHWDPLPTTAIWKSEACSLLQANHAILHAQDAYVYLSNLEDQASLILYGSEPMVFQLTDKISIQEVQPDERKKFIVLPLIINELPPLGALQLEGTRDLTEDDLEFVNALADLVSVALDRYYKTHNERELQKDKAIENFTTIIRKQEQILDLESERALRESFVSLLSHDLRTPLSAARMAAEMIARKPGDANYCALMASKIITNMARADHMIRNLLDANRIRSGERLPLNIEEQELNSLVEETVQELTTIHGDRFLLTGPSPIFGAWDKINLQRIIENLCNNAIKYGSPDTPVRVLLSQTANEVRIEVQNQGPALSKDDQASLFQQFKRSKAAQTSNKKGWGIGLTLVRGVAIAHGGEVSVSSSESEGTTFTVILPKDSKKILN